MHGNGSKQAAQPLVIFMPAGRRVTSSPAPLCSTPPARWVSASRDLRWPLNLREVQGAHGGRRVSEAGIESGATHLSAPSTDEQTLIQEDGDLDCRMSCSALSTATCWSSCPRRAVRRSKWYANRPRSV